MTQKKPRGRRPVLDTTKKQMITVRFDKNPELLDRVKRYAQHKSISLNAVMIDLVERGVPDVPQ